jgi:superfamily II DNA/RNA helicase
VDKIVQRYLSNPLTHSVDTTQASVTTMEHHVLLIGDQTQKKQLIVQLASGKGKRVLFMRTKHHARKLAKTLSDAGIPAVDLHGNLSQNARDRNLAEFSTGDVRVLVATDVAARGVHVDDVELVVHVDPPTEHKAYLHRSGRTARAGSDGTVVTITLPEQKGEVQKLMKAAGVNVGFENVTATSPLVGKLIGEPAEKIDPRTRAALLAQREAPRGGGSSTGANAERKRARRAAPAAGGRGGRGGRGRVAAEPQGNRAERRKDQPQAPRFGTDGADRRRTGEGAATGGNRTRRPRPARSGDVAAHSATGSRASQAPTGSGQRSSGQRASAPSAAGRPAAARGTGPRRAGAPASNERRGR